MKKVIISVGGIAAAYLIYRNRTRITDFVAGKAADFLLALDSAVLLEDPESEDLPPYRPVFK